MIGWWAIAAWSADAPPEVAVCAGCHGPDGNSPAGTWPSLAGQPVAYLEKELWDFKVGRRTDPTMSGMVAALDANAIHTVAVWFSSQTPAPVGRKPAPPDLVAAGEALFQRGDPARGLAPCRACHGDRAQGGQDPRGNAFPALAGQHAAYLDKQLSALAAGQRDNDPGGMMSLIARRLTPADVRVLSAYLDGLVPAPVTP
ncbi:MAG: c-type cytochrome [Myxococcota bacterium]